MRAVLGDNAGSWSRGYPAVTADSSDKLIQPNAENRYEVTAADLPLHCPLPSQELWNTHPRVFLDPKAGEAKCPYCGTVYRLKAGEKLHAH